MMTSLQDLNDALKPVGRLPRRWNFALALTAAALCWAAWVVGENPALGVGILLVGILPFAFSIPIRAYATADELIVRSCMKVYRLRFREVMGFSDVAYAGMWNRNIPSEGWMNLGMRMVEVDLRGRESVLALPLRQLYLERVAQGVLSQVPPTLEELSLEGAANLDSLQPIARARGLRELSIDGPRTLDLGAIAAFTELTSVTLTGIGALTGVSGLDGLRRLRELTLIGVGNIDDIGVLDRLTDRGVIVSADELEIRSR